MTPADLIAALEKAEGPSEDLDLAIAIAVYGRPGVIVMRHDSDTQTNVEYTHWRYTSSLDAALSLVPEGDREVIVAMRSNHKPCAEISSFPGYVSAHGATPAIALCIAALKARTDRSAA